MVESFADRYGLPELKRYGTDVKRQAEQFDMERLPGSLERFPKLVKDLRDRLSGPLAR